MVCDSKLCKLAAVKLAYAVDHVRDSGGGQQVAGARDGFSCHEKTFCDPRAVAFEKSKLAALEGGLGEEVARGVGGGGGAVGGGGQA